MAGIVQFDTKQVRKFGGRFAGLKNAFWNKVVYVEMHRFGRVALKTLRREAPGKRLPSKLYYKVGRSSGQGYQLTLGAKGYSKEILKYIIRGTRPHVIRPVRAKALRFYWRRAGGMVFFKRVFHPGTLANPFPHRTAISLQRSGELDRLGQRIGRKTVDLIVGK